MACTNLDNSNETESGILDLLLFAGRLKNLPRTGWRLVGIKDCESVADHTYRVILISMLLG
ncbi:MAG: HD domain-containing protein, partial [Anaerolineales bacterium]|nr:HD domain-containing protein [Anaerolineales bacterium]